MIMNKSVYYIGYIYLGKPFGHGRMVYEDGSFYVRIVIFRSKENGFLGNPTEVESSMRLMETLNLDYNKKKLKIFLRK